MKVTTEISDVQYGLAEASDMDEMARMLAAVFSEFDPPAVATGLTSAEFESFVRLFCPAAEADELTIVARASATGEMVGALLTDDSASTPPEGLDQVSEKFLPIFDILGELDAEFREGRAMKKGQYLHLFLLGVSKKAMGRQIAQHLVAECLRNGFRKGYEFAVTEATNSVSQHIFRKHGFQERVSRSYRDHCFQGKANFASIEGHTGPILMEKTIT